MVNQAQAAIKTAIPDGKDGEVCTADQNPRHLSEGDTSKGMLFTRQDLPEATRQAPLCDAILLYALDNPDSHGKQIDGMGNSGSLHTAPPMAQPWRSKHCISPNSLIFRFP